MEIQLHFVEKGSGEPLILLHGNGEDSGYFSHQIEHFSRSYRVLAVDTRGHGLSPRGDAPFTIRQFAEDLAGFLDQQEIQRANLLGFSDGANIALCFALRDPRRVDRLILNGANLNSRGVRPSVQLPIEIGYRIASRFAGRDPKAKQKSELLGLMVKDPDLRPEELAAVPVKTLVIAGTRDMIKRRHTEQIWRSLPNAELVWIRGDHFIAARHPREFNRAVEQFLQNSKNR